MGKTVAGTLKAAYRQNLLLLLAVAAAAGTASAAEPLNRRQQLDIVEHISLLRRLAGLDAVRLEGSLTDAADAHASYLMAHGGIDHTQQRQNKHFLGILPEDRAVASRYPSRTVREVIARSADNGPKAVDQLMASVYHRMQLLHPQIDEVGTGGRSRQGEAVYVLELGHSQWRKFCQNLKRHRPQKSAELAYGHCADESAGITVGRIESVRQSLLRRQPAAVIWPPHNYDDFPVLMSLETPRPLPERAAPGNPLTVKFNLSQGAVRVQEWQLLLQDDGGKAVRQIDTTLLSRQNDTNRLLREGEFALVPLSPLRHDTAYESVLVFSLGGETRRMRWSFSTQPLPWETLDLSVPGTVWTDSGQAWILQRQRGNAASFGDHLQLQSDGNMKIEIVTPYTNVHLASFTGSECASGKLRYRKLSRTLRIKPVGKSDPAKYCLQKLIAALPGQIVYGVNDLVELESGVNSAISLAPENDSDEWGRVRWAAPRSCEVKAEFEDALIMWVNIRCRSGKRIRFSFSNDRYFTVRIR